jgi:hypothetical protein
MTMASVLIAAAAAGADSHGDWSRCCDARSVPQLPKTYAVSYKQSTFAEHSLFVRLQNTGDYH